MREINYEKVIEMMNEYFNKRWNGLATAIQMSKNRKKSIYFYLRVS